MYVCQRLGPRSTLSLICDKAEYLKDPGQMLFSRTIDVSSHQMCPVYSRGHPFKDEIYLCGSRIQRTFIQLFCSYT